MKRSTVSKRYARALVDSIQDEPEYLDIREQLRHFAAILNYSPACKTGMETLLLSKKQKIEVLETFKTSLKLTSKTVNFLLAVIEENRMGYIDDMIRLTEEFWLEKNGFEKIKVFSAIELNREQREKLTLQLEKAIQKKIVIENETDPSLIAGIKIQRGLIEVNIPESMIKIGVHDANKG
jgi:F-type H+-transporting ATPase subunit delta